jgi:type IV secretion system protein VirD4
VKAVAEVIVGLAHVLAWLLTLIIFHFVLFFLLIPVTVAAFLLARFLFFPQIHRNRVRHMRLRMHLKIYPFRGHASLFELWLRWGSLAAFRKSGRIAWGVGFWERLRHPDLYSVLVGTAHWGRKLRVTLEEHILILGPPRTGKSGLLARMILLYPGPALIATTKADLYRLTRWLRSLFGPIYIFNPMGIGNLRSTIQWDPVDGCIDIPTAQRRAEAFAGAASSKATEDPTFWIQKSSMYLTGLFFAAAVLKNDLRKVANWVMSTDTSEAERTIDSFLARLKQSPQYDAKKHDLLAAMSANLKELRCSEANRTIDTIRMFMSLAVGWMSDPELATCALPPRGKGFDIATGLRERATLYMIAESRGAQSPVAPLFAALADEMHYQACTLGQSQQGGRLWPVFGMFLDEVAQIVPVTLWSWMSDAGGKGVTIVAVAHGEAQLRMRWDDGEQVIMDTAGCKIFVPGITDPHTLSMISDVVGRIPHKDTEFLSIVEPNMIRQLPYPYALYLRGGNSVVVGKLPLAWQSRVYKRGCKAEARAKAHAARQVIPEAVPLPGPMTWGEPDERDAA